MIRKPQITIKRAFFVLILTVLAVAASTSAQGQKMKYRLANKYYEQFDFRKAAEIYEDVIKDFPEDETALRLASDCRIRIDDFALAEQHLAALIELGKEDEEDLLNYAYVLKTNKKYDAAVVVYEKYLQKNPDPVLNGYTDVDWANRIVRDSARYEIKTTAINSPQSDFAPAFWKDGKVVFSSARKQGRGKRNIYNWTDQSYLNLFVADIAPDSTLNNPDVFDNKANSRYHEGTVALDKGQEIIYFTRNNYLKGKKEDDGSKLNLGIFYASTADEKMGKVKPFPFNDPRYSVGHPVISPDGKKMYFVSDMPGGQGGTDIYVSERNLDFWGEPQNLGPKVNTAGNEMFPFMDEKGTFYFASDWHPGLGGLDLFYTKLDSDDYPVLNFGYPVNSSGDDFGLIAYENGRHGYFSSDRPGGVGDDDIYEFIIHPATSIIICGRIVDAASLEGVPEATLMLKGGDDGNMLEVLGTTDLDGLYTVEVPIEDAYKLVGMKDGYFQNEIEVFSSDKSRYIDDADIALVASEYAAEGKVLIAETNEPAEGAVVYLKLDQDSIIQETVVNIDGKYYFGLEPNTQYELEATKTGYPSQSIEIETGSEPTVINSDLRLFNYEEGTIVRLDNIYYDYNKYAIREDAKRDLNRLADIMNKNPKMRIELSSHTDSRGTDSYNLRLSQRRAQAAMQYLLTKGIDKSRLVAKGYGEKQLLNKCTNDVECTDKQHQENRRTEFKILDI